MAKSIRVSDRLYDMASSASVLMHRSLAQQIEHWAALGQALEARGDTDIDEIMRSSLSHMHEIDRQRVVSGEIPASALHAIAPAAARKTKVRFHSAALDKFDTDR